MLLSSRSSLTTMVVLAMALTIVPLASSQSLSLNTLEAMGINCRSKHSCSVRTSSEFEDKGCECDSLCRNFDDCCLDATAPRRRTPITGLTCLAHGLKNKGAYAIEKCKSEWSGNELIRQNCESNSSNPRDPFLTIPVTDTRRSITYKNLLCAQCNDADMENLVTWPVFIGCEDSGSSRFNESGDISMSYLEDNLVYSDSARSWGVNHPPGSGSIFYKCRSVFDAPASLENSLRFCKPNLVSTCAANWRRANVRRQCGQYTAIVYTDDAAYRNPHCALCNNVNLSSIRCGSGTQEKTRPPMSFTMLVDVNTRDGNRVGHVNRCPDKHMWDPFSKKCRELVCGLPGLKAVNGRCVRE